MSHTENSRISTLTGFLAPQKISELRSQAGLLPLQAPQLLGPGAVFLDQAGADWNLTGLVQNALGLGKLANLKPIRCFS